MTLKGIMRSTLRLALRGQDEGLSQIGQLAKRVANHLEFQIRNLEQAAFHSHAPVIAAKPWPESTVGLLVYDIGANHGANIPYYRRQGFRVIAVEANPLLCRALSSDFADDGWVTVVNACIVAEATGDVPFYVNRRLDKLSTSIDPTQDQADFDRISVPSVTPAALISQYGKPFYVKIDIEGADAEIVLALGRLQSLIPYVSAEIFSIEVLTRLVFWGYREFKIVEGAYVHLDRYLLPAGGGKPEFRFAKGECAGPFGEDIPGPWVSADEVFAYLLKFGLGWKDLHARHLVVVGDPGQ